MITAVMPCRAAPRSRGDRPGVVAPPPLVFAVGLLLGLTLSFVLPPLPVSGMPATALATTLGVVAAGLAGSFVVSFRRAGTPVDPGKPTTALVTTGPYRLTRNPGYLGMACVYGAVTVATGSLGAAILMLPTLYVIDCGVIQREERYLEAKFGEEYRTYRRRVRRWV